MRQFFVALSLLVAIGSPVSAQDLIGEWRLVSWQAIIDGQAPQDLLGTKPRGFLSLSSSGRMIVLITGDSRKPGISDTERAALHKSMSAYSGTYRVEGREFITTVDVSWNEAYNGTDQRRFFKIDGDKLYVETAPTPSLLFPGKSAVRRLIWERVKP